MKIKTEEKTNGVTQKCKNRIQENNNSISLLHIILDSALKHHFILYETIQIA